MHAEAVDNFDTPEGPRTSYLLLKGKEVGQESRIALLSRTMEKESFGRREPDDVLGIQERTRRATRELLRWLPWAVLNLVVVGSSIVVGSIGFIATAVTLTIFSPILVPASVVLFVTVGGGLAVVACLLLLAHEDTGNRTLELNSYPTVHWHRGIPMKKFFAGVMLLCPSCAFFLRDVREDGRMFQLMLE
ncbi:hypothetical protein R1flu_001898 [Riccia fluitans]|uniref:Uncharacterized protein n=1 Tax=Riccia fluitans TaxID=41844 RepID=A0ABD1Y4U3_9MARC